MGSMKNLVDMLQRAKDGPPCSVRRWETEVIPNKVKNYLERYDLIGTFNPEEPVNRDTALADRFFQAGLELAADIGMLCTDTESIVKVDREELERAINDAPARIEMGEGEERIAIIARHPEDPEPPVFAAPLAIQVDEELFVPLTEGILKSRHVKIQCGPSIDTIFGNPLYAGTPFETAAAFMENELRRQAQWRAGRVGMANRLIASSVTEYGQMAAYGDITSPANPALAIILHPAELKVNFASFHKAAVGLGYKGFLNAGSYTMIGGYGGGAEATALGGIAADLLQFPILQAHASANSIYDVRFDSTCGRHGLWAMSINLQAISRNTHLLMSKIINQTAGPCTEEILYTSVSGLIAAAVSGQSFTVGVRSAGGRYKNYLSPLEHWFCGAAYEAAAGLTLEKANELVLYLLSRYETGLKNTPKGKSFTECFDIRTLKPTAEWSGIADRVRRDLANRGLSMEW